MGVWRCHRENGPAIRPHSYAQPSVQPSLIQSSMASSTALCISPLRNPYLLNTSSLNCFSKVSDMVRFMRTVLDFLLIPYTYAPILFYTYLCIGRYVHEFEHRQWTQSEGFGNRGSSWNHRSFKLENLPSEIPERERLVSSSKTKR